MPSIKIVLRFNRRHMIKRPVSYEFLYKKDGCGEVAAVYV